MISAGSLVAKILKAEGTELLFCFPTTEIIEAAAIEGIRVITCRTERTVVNMADGYTRVKNGHRIGVCAVQAGPGIENAFVGVAQAYADSTPILMLTGGPTLDRLGLPAMFAATKNYDGVTQWADTINGAGRVPGMLLRAFTKLRNGRRRPVLLELPADVAVQQIDEANVGYAPVRRYASAGDPADVSAAITALLRAEHPLIYVGQGVLWGEATAELVAFAELLGIPVMTTILAKSAFPEDHPLSIGIGGNNVTGMVDHYLKAADVVLCIGASLTKTLAATPVPASKIVIHCTSDPGDLNTEIRAAYAVIGDVKLVLGQLTDEARRQGVHTADVGAEIARLREHWLEQWMPKLTSDEVPINPYRIVWDLMHSVDRANTIVTHDSGTPRAQIATFYRAPVPRSYIGWGNSHQLGSSLGLIMGAKLAAPEKLAVAFMGDAAFGMCGMDFETAVRERIPILAIVLNNSWMAAYSQVIPEATERYDVGHISGNYAQVAEGLGCWAERVTDPKEIVPAIQRAIAVVASGRAAVLEFMTRVEPASSRLGAPMP